jgi:selenide,water dikinase
MPRDVALLGGGHAHIEVIRRWGLDPPADARLTVYDPNPRPVYSGMVPGFIAGQYERRELEIDLKVLCDRASARFIPHAVTRVDAQRRMLELADGSAFGYDAASLDIGSTVAGMDLPGVREFALPSRPITTLISNTERVLGPPASSDPLYVVGGGAGGVELAFCLDARIRRAGDSPRPVALVTSDGAVLERMAAAVRRRVERAFARRGIATHPNSDVAGLERASLELEDGRSLPASGVVWVTGPAAHPLASDSDLPIDERGFVRIERTLQVVGRDGLFAVGDCASLAGMQRAGVYAVRSGPLLDLNLRALLGEQPLRRYTPQHDFLSLLNLGDGTAIGTKWGIALEGRSMMWLKDRIDRSFMETYR